VLRHAFLNSECPQQRERNSNYSKGFDKKVNSRSLTNSPRCRIDIVKQHGRNGETGGVDGVNGVNGVNKVDRASDIDGES
jgi:hypothetical protein